MVNRLPRRLALLGLGLLFLSGTPAPAARAANHQPRLVRISAVFNPAAFATTYTATATDPDGDPLKATWKLSTPADPACNKFVQTSAGSAVWHHGDQDGCNHVLQGPFGHRGTISFIVSDREWRCVETFAGSLSRVGGANAACALIVKPPPKPVTTTAATTTTTVATTTTTATTTTPTTTTTATTPAVQTPRSPRASTLARAVVSPSKAFSSVKRTLENLAIAAALVLLIIFPAQLFNHTFEENYADIRAWWERRFKAIARARAQLGGDRPALAALVVILVGGVLGGLLDPTFGLGWASAVTFAGVVCATVLGIAAAGLAERAYRRRRRLSTAFHPHALPAGLLVAGVCVLISRLAGFEPGYLYGLVCGVAFASAYGKREEGQTAALKEIALVALALVAWVALVPLNRHAGPGGSWAAVFGADLAGALCTGGLVGAMIGALPLEFMPGGRIVAWSRAAWAAFFGGVTFLFLELLLNPGEGGSSGHAPLVTVIVLFAVFGVGSVAFYAHFARKRKRA